MALQLFNKFKILTFYHHLNIKWFSERYIASLIWLVMLLSVPLSASAAQVSVLASTSQIATGAGLTGTPSLNNFTIPAGKNRQVLVIAGFERDHCDQASDVCNLTYVAGTGGLSDNFARPVSSVYQITARISGSGGTIDKKNALTIGGTPSGDLRFSFQENNLVDANAVQIPNSTLFSTESYHIALNETEINTLLGGSPSGTVSISLPDVLQPKSAGDDAILMAFVFSNVEQTDSGIVRSAVPQLTKSTTTIPGNYTLTASAFDPGQAPNDINDGLLVVGFSTIGQPSSLGGFLTMSGYTQLQSTVTNNSNGIYDNSEPQWTTVEPDGLSMSAQFRNGVASAFTLQSNADSSLSAWGGWAPAFTISSDNADTSDAPASYGTSTHTISGIRLGATVDADATLLSSSNATGDDSSGGDDEDGVTLPSSLTVSSSNTISVNIQNASGYLSAWFDWNQDGDFLDSGEKVISDQSVVVGNQSFSINVPSTTNSGLTFARFRVCSSTDQCNVPSSVVSTGEVEDYVVTVKGNQSLSGVVFEDINYGGGNGRNLGVSAGKGTNGTKVELYNSSGSLVGTTTTANDGLNDGAYLFTGLAAGNYYVRVVNSTVKSTRTGSNGTERGVQTYRTDGTTDVTNEIGGRAPNLADAGANTGSETLNTSTFSLSSSGTVQSVQPVTVTNLNISGVMFGFNFDTIVNTNDSGQGSLRQFILNSNLLGNAGLAQSGLTAGLETSIFQIPGTGPFTISPSSALPAITDSYTAINGSTQSGSSCAASARTLMIALSGTNAGATVSGLTVNAANALIKGLAIGNFTDAGVSANSAGSNLTVKCSNIGLNTDGTTAMQNGTFGIYDNAGGNLTIGGTSVDDRNIISNNFKDGIKLNSVVTALIQNNYVGMSADGLTAKSNNQEAADQAGILLTGTSAVPSKTITVTGNVIAGNNKANTAVNANNTTKGIRLSYANFVTITNNKIGTTPDGMTALANTGYGIYTINSTDITIGGTTAADRNIISGNGQDGINTRSGTNRISILGNYIGLGSDGVKALGNANNGIFLADTSNATIGNSSASGRNIIGSNSYSGIRNSTSTGTKITDNYVGTDVSGTLDRGNTLHGVYVNNANDVVVGGSNAADGNLVVYNKVIGVFTDKTATNNTNTLIENNYVGMLKDGETIAGNTQAGVETKNNVGVTIRNNLISGNKTRGIHLVNSPSTTITNNRIGTNANGTSDKGNLNHGIDVETAAATLLVNNNVISGNDQSGIRLINGDATGTIITNNRIGTNQDGSSAIANTLDGITIDNVPNFTIGSTTTTGNTISGNNRHGIVIANASTKNLTVVGNLIGLNSAGTAALANANQGIMVQNGATAIKIGDGSAAGSNKIAYNGDNGIILSGTSTNDVSISQNSIYANTTLGIDINLDKVTINDANDSDTGPNAVLNFPLIKSANLNSGNLTLSGCAPTGAILEFFEADVSPTSSSGVSAGANKTTLTQDYGEGEQFIARFTEGVGEDTQSPPLDCASLVGADGNSAVGMSPFQWTITTPSTLVSGDKVTATATVTGTGTSEFSGVASALNPIDYADAPASYGTPSHNIVSGVQLGLNIDADSGAFATTDATGDDLDSSDDEDAIITMPSFMQGSTASVTVKATGAGGYLQGWIDWDGSGTFEANEQVAPNLQDNGAGDLDSTTGTIQFSVSVPSYAVTTKTYARFRWSTVANLDATSAASNGEVEDYALTIARSALCSTIEDKEALFLHDDNGKRIFRIDNVATTPVLDSTPVMSTVAGSAGLTISHNLNGGTPSPTFYVVAGGRYYWFNDSTWVNTSHSVTSYDVAPNPGGGVNYIFSYNGTDVWRYDGTSTPSTPLVTGINASMASYYDVATDAQDNFYIVKSTAGKILKYSKDGALLATYTAIGIPTGLQPGYAMIGNDMYVFANGGGIYRGVQNNDVVNFSKIATISISGVTINDIAACPSASIGFQTPKYNLSGVVFEDINYGGGAGRDFTTAAGKGVNGATVELYKADGTYVGNTTTANDGTQDGVYTFNQVLDGNYYVRVVNDTVNSTRVGSNGTELGVQTFRTDGTTAVTNEVGGHNPSLADGAANTGTETLNTTTYQLSGGANVQSLQAVTLAGADLSGIEFGFNFDTIVNTKANGQGSFAQFLANSNLLKNDNLDQADTLIAIPAGQETTIFMIPTTDTGFVNSPDGGTGKAWLIATGTQYLTMTDANTAVDGSTQTASMGNTNAAVSDITLGSEIIISNSGTPNNSNYGALTIRDTVGFVRNIGITTSSNIAGVTVYQTDMTKTLTSGSEITQITSFNVGNSGITLEGAKGVKVENNISRAAGKVNTISDGLIFVNGANQNTVRNNIFHSNSSCGIDLIPSIKNSNNLIESNQIYNNGYGSTSSQEAGICIRSGDSNTIRNNTIYKNKNDGITVMSGNQSNVFTQNAIYQNGNIGIDLGTGSNSLGDGITVNDANDADTGGNNLLNFAMIKQALSVNGKLVIQGCAPSGSTIELYEADVSPTSVSQVAAGSNKFGKTQDYGEGERYLTTFVEGAGEDTVTTPVDCATLTDADGNSAVGMSPFQWTLTMPSNVLIDDKLTVTATNASNTSEFSPVVSLQLYQDRGDASASYGDAAHTINAAVYLGTTLPDMDASSVASTGADGDDISGIDDEDSVSILPSLYTSSTGTSVNVKVLNSTGNKAWLVGWIDFNKNGVFDSNEAATIPVSSAAQVKTVGLTWANLSGLTAGDTHMRLRVTTDPLIATGVASTSLATGTATDGEVEDYVVTIQQDGAVLTGKVFNDANVNGINDTEAGIDNVTVVLKDDSANTCRSVQTQADGSYQFAGLAAGSYTVYEAANANVPVPDTCPPVTADPTGYSSSTANSKTLSIAANATVQQDFGDVASPSFTLDNSLVTQPNTTVVHPHIFRTEVNGEVSLSLIEENLDPSNLLWESQLLRDANCDSKLNAGDTVITGAISLNAGDKLCILTKVLTPANASSGATQTLTLQSEFTYGDGSVLTATNKQTRTDTTKVNAASSDTAVSGAGKLDLKKFVWNVTRNQSGETALPGETLRYTIQYENIGDGVLDELVVHDALPSFTDLVAGSPTCVQTPTELSLCTPHVVDNAIDWSFVGKLQAGNHGSVSYEVVIH